MSAVLAPWQIVLVLIAGLLHRRALGHVRRRRRGHLDAGDPRARARPRSRRSAAPCPRSSRRRSAGSLRYRARGVDPAADRALDRARGRGVRGARRARLRRGPRQRPPADDPHRGLAGLHRVPDRPVAGARIPADPEAARRPERRHPELRRRRPHRARAPEPDRDSSGGGSPSSGSRGSAERAARRRRRHPHGPRVRRPGSRLALKEAIGCRSCASGILAVPGHDHAPAARPHRLGLRAPAAASA